MFQVKAKITKEVVNIYGVVKDEYGETKFLWYYKGEWVWEDANDFEPI